VYGGVSLAALAQVVLATLAPTSPPGDEVAAMTPREKAALVVVSGLPAPRGVAGVLVRRWDRDAPRPRGALVFVDQEGGGVRAFPTLPPERWPSEYRTVAEAQEAGHRTGAALRRAGVHVDLAPVLDSAGGPLGGRHYRGSRLALAFARGLAAGGLAGCVKHFPGLGTAAFSTDDRVWVPARVTQRELDAFRAAVDAGVPCVMTSHAVYRRFGWGRALTSPRAHRMLRRMGFEGVVVTDSLSVVSGEWPVRWARRAVRAGADLVLFTSPRDARRAIRALIPLARRGVLDVHVRRVLALQRSLGVRAG
jgi:beta-glucosidase-like glycosyl hydrolase